MSKIIELLSSIKKIKSIGGSSTEQVEEAQNELNLVFPEEYKQYLLNFGAVRFNGVEICGLNLKGYLNVVEATEREKSINPLFPPKMFVIEDLGIDAKLIISDEKGYIYLLQSDTKRLLCTSFSDYIEKCIYR